MKITADIVVVRAESEASNQATTSRTGPLLRRHAAQSPQTPVDDVPITDMVGNLAETCGYEQLGLSFALNNCLFLMLLPFGVF